MRRLLNPTNSAYLILVVPLFAFLALTFTYSANVSAQSKGKLCSGANLDVSGSKTSCSKTQAGNVCHEGNRAVNCNDKRLNNLIGSIINVFSIIVGVVAVIMMIYGGFRYITSAGESGKVEESKKTIIYAVVGLIIVALAQFIVKFVLEKATKS